MAMNTLQEPQYAVIKNLQSVMDSGNGLVDIVSRTLDDLLRIQSEALAPVPGAPWPSLSLALTADGWSDILWNVPVAYQAQTRRLVGTLLDSFTTLSRGQHELLEWGCQSFSGNVQQTTTAMSQVTGAVASRRVSAEIIHFSDRRAQSERESLSHDASFATEEKKGRLRTRQQGAA